MLGVLAFGAVGATLRDPGLTWDESIYFGFSLNYCLFASELGRADWYDSSEITEEIRKAYADVPRPWGAFSRPVVHRFWRAGQAHPPLAPLCYAVGLGAFHRLLGPITAFRLPASLIFTGLVLATYFFFSWAPPSEGAKTNARISSGAIAAASLVLMPRCFGHGHFAALDVPTTLMWLLTVMAFRKGMFSRPWAVATGVIFGLALLTKINAAFLPLILWPWGLMAYRRKSLPAILGMLILGPGLFVLGWPWLWHHTFANIWVYLADKASRLHIPVYYLGVTYDKYPPPWHYPFILTTVTVPLGLLVAALLGLWQTARKWRADPTCSLVLINLIVIYGVAAFPWVPKYDGARLFLPAFPFVAGLAAMGIVWVMFLPIGRQSRQALMPAMPACRSAKTPWKQLCARWNVFADRPAEPAGLNAGHAGLPIGKNTPEKQLARRLGSAVFALVLVWDVASYHPYELSYYNGLVGGLRGAHWLGFETEYWGDVFDAKAMDAVNRLCVKDAAVCVEPLDIRVPRLLQRVGELREDLKFVTESEPCDYLVLLAREGYFSERDWALYKSGQPLWKSSLRGVPLCMIFQVSGDAQGGGASFSGAPVVK